MRLYNINGWPDFFKGTHKMEIQRRMNTMGDKRRPRSVKMYSTQRRVRAGCRRGDKLRKAKESRCDDHVSNGEEETGLRARWQGKAKQANQAKSCEERDSWGREAMTNDGVPKTSRKIEREDKESREGVWEDSLVLCDVMCESCRRGQFSSEGGVQRRTEVGKKREKKMGQSQVSHFKKLISGWRKSPSVPNTHTVTKTQRKILSMTIATYFQSSSTWRGERSFS